MKTNDKQIAVMSYYKSEEAQKILKSLPFEINPNLPEDVSEGLSHVLVNNGDEKYLGHAPIIYFGMDGRLNIPFEDALVEKKSTKVRKIRAIEIGKGFRAIYWAAHYFGIVEHYILKIWNGQFFDGYKGIAGLGERLDRECIKEDTIDSETGRRIRDLCIKIAATRKFPQKKEDGRYVMDIGNGYKVTSSPAGYEERSAGAWIYQQPVNELAIYRGDAKLFSCDIGSEDKSSCGREGKILTEVLRNILKPTK